MGDPRRFELLGDFIAETWTARALRIADVAGGKGGLHAALYQRGYRNVVTFDKRRNRANPARTHYRYAFFDGSQEGFDLIVGMHPDEATDVAMDYAIRRGLPYAIVPCCARPTVWPFEGQGDRAWFAFLIRQAQALGSPLQFRSLPMKGAGMVLYALTHNSPAPPDMTPKEGT